MRKLRLDMRPVTLCPFCKEPLADHPKAKESDGPQASCFALFQKRKKQWERERGNLEYDLSYTRNRLKDVKDELANVDPGACRDCGVHELTYNLASCMGHLEEYLQEQKIPLRDVYRDLFKVRVPLYREMQQLLLDDPPVEAKLHNVDW